MFSNGEGDAKLLQREESCAAVKPVLESRIEKVKKALTYRDFGESCFKVSFNGGNNGKQREKG